MKRYTLYLIPHLRKTFIDRSVHLEEEPMQEVELVEGGCSHPPHNDDVSDVSLYDFSNSDMEYEDADKNAYHESPTFQKWDEKTIQAAALQI